MLLAALSPLVLLRLIPIAEAAAHTNWRSGAGSQTLGPIAGPAATMRRVVDSNWGGMSGGGLRAAPAAAAAGPSGLATAGAAGAMTGAVRTRGIQNGGRSSQGGDAVRYAAVGGDGQTARPTAPSSGQSATAAPSKQGPGASSESRQPTADGARQGAGGPRPMAPARDLSGNDRQGERDRGDRS